MKNLQPRPSLTRVYYHILQKMLKSSLELLISISCVPVGLLVDKVEGWICHFNILPRCQIDLGWQYCWKDFFLLSCHTSACLVCMFYSQIHIITDYLLWMTQAWYCLYHFLAIIYLLIIYFDATVFFFIFFLIHRTVFLSFFFVSHFFSVRTWYCLFIIFF